MLLDHIPLSPPLISAADDSKERNILELKKTRKKSVNESKMVDEVEERQTRLASKEL